MDVPFIQRQTEKGLPHYTLWPDGDGIDNDGDGEVDDYEEFDTVIYNTKEELVPVADGYWRLENESEFVRFRKAAEGWVATRRDGVVLEFGSVGDSRVESDGRVFRWHLDRMLDPNGNAISFEYVKLDDSAQTYLKRIVYNRSESSDAAMEATFDYDRRPDVITDFRPRFELKTGYRCTKISVLVGGEPVRSYEFAYAAASEWRPLSLLESVAELGRDGVSGLPPTLFRYTGSDRVTPAVRLLDQAPNIDLNDPNIDLLDVNADGLPDIIDTGRRPHAYYLNKGEDDIGKVKWTGQLRMQNDFGLELGGPDVRFADMNGDGHTDLLNLYSTAVYYYSIKYADSTPAAWHFESLIEGAGFAYDDYSFRLQDVDHDKRIDVIQTTRKGSFAWVNQVDQDGDAWSDPHIWSQVGSLPQTAQSSTLFADMNGDRLLDLVEVEDGTLNYFPAKGFGEFGKRIAMETAPRIYDPARLFIADVNGDGRGDVAYLGGMLEVWLNQGLDPDDHTRGLLASPFSVRSSLLDAFAAHRQADVNGNGSTDVLFLDNRYRLAFVEFSPGAPPNLLESIDNGIGGRTRIEYSSSVAEMVRDAADGRPWSQAVPFPVPVVSRMEVDDGSSAYLTEFAYRDGYYDPVEKEFRGFAEVVKTEAGDETIPPLVTKHIFNTGRKSEALKGKLLAVETRDPDGKLFFRERHDWGVKALAEGVVGEGRRVTHAFQSVKRLDAHEGLESPVSARWDYEHDDFGNVTRVHEHGRLDPGWEDERITETAYTSSYRAGRDAWILDRVVKREVLDPSGNRVSAERRYYDGNSALGDIAAGNPTRVERWIDGDRWLDSERKDYDEFGNVTAIYDGEYRAREGGHFREAAYDPEFNTYPVREIVHTGNAAAPRLEMSATYDPGFGTMTSSTDFNGHSTTYSYDAFGRLVSIAKPGDSADKPTEAYQYVLNWDAGDGVRVNWVETRKRERAGKRGTLDSRVFHDGLGRKIMTRAEDEIPGRVVVADTVRFNARSLPWREYLPYFETGTLDFSPPRFASAFLEHRYDALGREVRVTQPDASFSAVEYEPFGKTVRDEEQTDPESRYAGSARRFLADGLQDDEGEGRLREVHEIVKLTDDGRRSNAPVEWTTRYDYDLLDNLVQITDSQGNRKRAAFDGLGRKVLDEDPNRGTTVYSHDDASNLRETIDAKGQRITYGYDGANRLVSEDYHDEGTRFSANRSPDVIYMHDRSAVEAESADSGLAAPRNTLGRLASVFDLSGETHMSYDPRGRIERQVKRVLNPRTGSLESYASDTRYDSMDRVTQLAYPDGSRISYSYNPRGLLESVASGGTDFLANLDYNSSGQFARIDHGNGVSATYEYDDRLRLNRLTAAKPGEPPLLSYAYRLDKASNIVEIDDRRPELGFLDSDSRRVNDQSFEYDDLYRLLEVRYGFEADAGEGEAGISYRYDRVGNLLEQSSGILHRERGRSVADPGRFEYLGGRGQLGGRVPGDPPGPHSATGTDDYQLSYDDNGNVVRLGDMRLAWDFKDRLVAVEFDQITAEYVYDHEDRRITKHVDYNDGNNVTDQVVQYVDRHYEVRDGETEKYVYAGSRRVAKVGSLPQIPNYGQAAPLGETAYDISYYHQDHLGSTNATADAAGNLREEFAYYPYGHAREIYRPASSETEPYQFSQKETDKETGLQYFEARYLDGAMARFLSVDPVLRQSGPYEDPQRWNAYSYSLNRPLVYEDPTGGFAHMLVGGVSSVAFGLVLAKATGAEYGIKNAALDFSIGAVGVGVAGKIHQAQQIRKLRKFAKANKMTSVKVKGSNIEKFKKGDQLLQIKKAPATSKGIGPDSKYPRYSYRSETKIKTPRGIASIYSDPLASKSKEMLVHGKRTSVMNKVTHRPLNPLKDEKRYFVQRIVIGGGFGAWRHNIQRFLGQIGQNQ